MIEEPWIINLNRLQDKDLRIRALETRLTLIPPEKIALKNQAAANRVKVEKAQKVVQDLELEMRRCEGRISDFKDNIKKLETQSAMVKKNNEYQAMLQNIADLKNKIGDEESSVIELLDKIEDAKKAARQSAEDVKSQNASLKMEFFDLETLANDIKKELEDLKTERAKFSKVIEPELLARYENLLKRGNGKPLVPIHNGTCGHCHLKITPQTLNSAAVNAVAFCDNCQHIIYMEDQNYE